MVDEIHSVWVQTPSRLHFGLLSIPTGEDQPEFWPDQKEQKEIPARHFGGVGLMIEAPGVQIAVRLASAWSADGPLAQRALKFAKQFSESQPVKPCHLTVEQSPAEHLGLGTGTQLGLGVAKALALANGLKDLDDSDMARRIGRGKRSAIGIHGFAQGGFLVDGGKRKPDDIGSLIARQDFPQAWPILLILPAGIQGTHGAEEKHVFDQMQQRGNLRNTEALSRLVILGMLPALREGDLSTFGEALYDFNRRAGEWFRPWQSGIYAQAKTEAVVDFIRKQGVLGVGQSSWGPTLFAVTEPDRATKLAEQLRHRFDFAPEEILITRANNHGHKIDFFREEP